MDKKCCGTCNFNLRDFNQRNKHAEFYCDNENSDMYGVPTRSTDCCEDYEEKEDE